MALKRVRTPVALVVIVFALALGTAQVRAQQTVFLELPPNLEAVAIRLDKQIMCPVCPSETLNQSQATLAKQMRAIIRERLAAGQSPEQVSGYFVSVYGESVLAEPPASGVGLAVWLVPPAGLAVGIAALALALKSMRRPQATARASAPGQPRATTDPDLERYLDEVDREFGSNPGPSRHPEGVRE